MTQDPLSQLQLARSLRFKKYKTMTQRELEDRRDHLKDDVSKGLSSLDEVRSELEFLERLITHKIAGSPKAFPLTQGKSGKRW
jgi:hypothetical protein